MLLVVLASLRGEDLEQQRSMAVPLLLALVRQTPHREKGLISDWVHRGYPHWKGG